MKTAGKTAGQTAGKTARTATEIYQIVSMTSHSTAAVNAISARIVEHTLNSATADSPMPAAPSAPADPIKPVWGRMIPHPKTKVLRLKWHYIRLKSFERVLREAAQDFKTDLRFQPAAVECIQALAEAYLVDLYRAALAVTRHAGRKTLFPKDIQLARRILMERC